MADIAIRVENLSKRYRIGARQKRANTLRETLGNLAASPFDYLRRTLRGPTEEDIIWALKDVSFEVQRGEVVGIPSLRQAQYKRQAQDKHWAQRGGQDDAAQNPLPHHRADGGLDRDPRMGGMRG
jgi:hypothetical protein